jgi:peptidoglycan hydrolase-like protein with peptidoglycan-binding domain
VQGDDVAAWQKCVAIEPDGTYGPLSEAATRSFQKKLGLVPDGIVGPKSYGKMDDILRLVQATIDETKRGEKKPAPPPFFPGFCRRGDAGDTVKHVQRRFVERGIPLVVDGDFGPATDRTVRGFQGERGLAVDGIVGPSTWGELWS